ncbi:nucleotidyl transferase [Enterobacter phage vB_EclM_Q7622]|uniref:nucleotidyl transferase n=1 Tax=Enterobacter phage vB_EclM_Q7622 TaxID=2908628 RepID=UPI0023298727|nr:nucleotidyl transferase [Enterobacter phage vB_EclM_Q7622]UIS65564.1 nucleotidyl transferase [Enterobacter phage vB_EclM_Q7622]
MKKAVILGAGLATRLYPITHHIPKVLVNYKQDTILKNLATIYTDLGADEVIVVVHSKFQGMVEAYAEQEGLKINVQTVDESYGSAYALALLHPILDGHNVVVNWCDIIPDFGSWSWGDNAIYTKGDECRYNFDGEYLSNVGATGGNVVGIYQFKDWEFFMGITKEEINNHCQGQDFVDFVYGKSMRQSELLNLIDLGDKPKLANAHSERELNRSFNSVEINEDTVTKIAVTEQGRKLQEDEVKWYYSVHSNSIPQIVNYNKEAGEFEMERIHGLPMFEHIKTLKSNARISMIDKILDALRFEDAMSKSIDRKEIEADFKKEFHDKVIDRCASIQPVIDSFGKITHVNGVKIGRLVPMLKQALNHLVRYQYSKRYHVIHGDPNFSNTMITFTDGDIKFIDPRGYFGNTKIYGPRLYDEAKVLYAVSGYDEFNADALWGGLNIEGEHAYVNIEPLIYKYEKMDTFNEHHHLAVAIIWIALGGYFKNNPLKAVSAYYYGMYLLTKQLRKMGRMLKDGTVAKDLPEAITATLITKNSDKWELIDKETGAVYKPIGGDITHQWERIR